MSSPGKTAGETAEWIARNAMPLHSLDPEHGPDGLAPLREVLKDVRVAGLGEATHGSREFFTLKHRIIRFLVTELGFTVIAIEAGHAACRAVNEHILHGTGDAATALRGLGYWTWNTEEVLALVEWLREYNTSVPTNKKVTFRGIDPVLEPPAIEAATGYLAAVAPERVDAFRQALHAFDTVQAPASLLAMARELAKSSLARLVGRGRDRRATAERHRHARKVIADTLAFAQTNEDALVAASSAADWESAVDHLWVLDRAAEVVAHPALGSAGGAIRDQYMAEAVQRILDAEPAGVRLVVWAHNGHIGCGALGRDVPSLGAHLRDRYQDSYFALGLTFDHGDFQALKAIGGGYDGPVEFTLEPAGPGTVEWEFARAGRGDCLVDLRVARHDPVVRDWVHEPNRMRSFGSVIGLWSLMKKTTAEVTLAHDYDGLAFVERTTRARPLPHH